MQKDDVIYKQAAIDAVDSETVSTNPEHFKSSEKFIKFIVDADIASFGKWQWANGFNTALVATKVQLEKLPPAQPALDEWCHDCKEYDSEKHCCPRFNRVIREAMKDAQPERPKGRWIRITQGAMPEQYICPFCHRTVESYGVEELLSIRYPYCHCGADMRGAEDDKQRGD